MDNSKLRVAFLYMKGRLARLADAERGLAPTEFFYGAIELSRRGAEVRHFEIDPARPATIGRGACPGTHLARDGAPGENGRQRGHAGVCHGGCLECRGLHRRDRRQYRLRPGRAGEGEGDSHSDRWHSVRRFCIFKHGYFRREISGLLLRRMHTLLFGEAERAADAPSASPSRKTIFL